MFILLSIINAIVNYWKIAASAIVGIVITLFAISYKRKSEQLKENEKTIEGLKAKVTIAKETDAIEKEKDEKLKEVKDAKEDTLLNRLRNMSK